MRVGRALRDAFHANSSRPAQSRKRQDVAAGSDVIFLPQERTVVGVAATLRAGGFKSADSYLGELRLGHVDPREVPAWLASILSHKRALLRGRGSKNKAAELKLHDIAQGAELLEGEFFLASRWPCGGCFALR